MFLSPFVHHVQRNAQPHQALFMMVLETLLILFYLSLVALLFHIQSI